MKRTDRRVSRGVAAGGAIVMLTLAGTAAVQAVSGPPAPRVAQPVVATVPLPQARPAQAPALQASAVQAQSPRAQPPQAARSSDRHYDGPGRHDDGFRGSKRGYRMRSNGWVDGVLAGTSYGYAFGSRYGQFGGYPGYPNYFGQGYYNQYPYTGQQYYQQYPNGGTYPYSGGTTTYPYNSGTYPYYR